MLLGQELTPKGARAVAAVVLALPDGESLEFLTNHLTLGASTIAAIYKERWQIELFFKALKQHLRVKTFVGTSVNALYIQIWTALIALLLLKYLQLKARFGWSLSNLVALLRMNLFVYRDLWAWLHEPFTAPPLPLEPAQEACRRIPSVLFLQCTRLDNEIIGQGTGGHPACRGAVETSATSGLRWKADQLTLTVIGVLRRFPARSDQWNRSSIFCLLPSFS